MCWRIERIAAIVPRMYVVSSVIATFTASSEHMYESMVVVVSSLSMEGQFWEL